MKKNFIFLTLAVLCGAMCFAQNAEDWRIHPDDATYKIYGHFETTFPDGRVSYELTDVNPVGLSFPVEPKYYGGQTTQGNVYFTFDHVTYSGKPDFDNIALWTYDETLDKWIADVETGKKENDATNTNEMTVVLVLDCSSSLGDKGFAEVKRSAKSFIDVMLYSSGRGNIHLGIIGFSTMQQTHTLELQRLNSTSAQQMKNFIDKFEQGNGTALYKSFDAAVDMTQAYIKNMEHFAGAAIVTFTDGLDNGSNNFDKKIGSKQAYYKHIKDNVLNKSIGGQEYQSYTIFVPGGADVKDPAIERKIVEELKTIAKRENRFFYVTNTSGLDQQFRQIAQSLIDSWKVLSCFISAGQNGRVCWTFGKKEIKPTPAPAPKPEPKPVVNNGRRIFLGLNGTIGIPIGIPTSYASSYSYSYYDPYTDSYTYQNSYNYSNAMCVGINIKLGLDFAYPVADRFAIGFYTMIGGGPSFNLERSELFAEGGMDFKVGLLMLAGDISDRPFIIGFAPCTGFAMDNSNTYVPLELRFGRITKEHLYITGNLTFGVPLSGGFMIEPAISIGYHFGDKLKTKR